MKKEIKKVVLAYSGGLDTSIILPWLKNKYHCETIAYIADVGQGDDMEAVKKKAFESGADDVVALNLQEEFVTEYIYPTLKAGAVYQDRYLLGTSMARPIISKYQVETAHKFGADAVAHGATGKGNDQVRFELGYMSLDPKLKIVTPWRDPDWDILSREDAIDYAKENNIPIDVTRKKIYSRDKNLWHLSHEGGELEFLNTEPTNDLYQISETIENAPDKAEYVKIRFVEGIPVEINGKELSPVDLIMELNNIGGRNGIGQIDIVEDRLVGIKSRGVYETPGGTILFQAHQMLENVVLDRQMQYFKKIVALKYADLVYNGEWFYPLREALDAFVDETQKVVSGVVKVKLFKGNIRLAGIETPYSLHSESISSFTMSESFNQYDSTGFIRIFGQSVKLLNQIQKKD